MQPGLVVETYLSDKSFNETLEFPSDGRYFYVKLSYTSDVINIRPTMIGGATVQLIDDANENISYVESGEGLYIISDSTFKALPDRKYKLSVTLKDGKKFESTWESTPESRPVGKVGFTELEKPVYKYEIGEQVIRTVKGVNVFISVPPNETGSPIFYRWDYDLLWLYIAPYQSMTSANKKCWIVEPYYLNDYAVGQDNVGGYDEPLFFIETVKNERIDNEVSVLVTQKVLTQDHYFFFKEMKDQVQGGFTNDIPPFNLKTNIQCISDETRVSGYFGITSESATRWYFSRHDLSYFVTDRSREICNLPNTPPPLHCSNCMEYAYGEPTNIEPSWWGK